MHEALTHGYSAEVSEPVCAEIFQSGYRVGERVLRPARVAVLEPAAARDPERRSTPSRQHAETTTPSDDPTSMTRDRYERRAAR